MRTTSQLRFLYLSYLSKPLIDRPVYRIIRTFSVRRILEVGIGNGQRALRMIEVAAWRCPASDIHYTGIDPFEARPAGSGAGLSLKGAYRLLKRTAAKVRLIPGDPLTALSRAANTLGGTELVLISADQDPDSLAQAWFYVPRMLAPGAHVLMQEPYDSDGELALRRLTREDVDRLAAAAATVRRAA